jgi:branched-chain amino acid transport system ATP-binding protein
MGLGEILPSATLANGEGLVMNILQLNGVSKSFGGLTAVADLDLTISEGEIVGMIGPNGAGKTTVFNLITGFHPLDRGEIYFNGENITRLKPYDLCFKGIGRTFQIVKPFATKSVIRNVMVGAFCRVKTAGKAEECAREVLDFTGLDPKKGMLAKNLTIADRKRLELAKALATRPKLLLLDEVMAGLTPKETDDMISLVRKIRDQGITLFIIEHVMQAVMTISERVVLLHHGEKIMEGTPEEVASDVRAIKAYLGEEYVVARG